LPRRLTLDIAFRPHPSFEETTLYELQVGGARQPSLDVEGSIACNGPERYANSDAYGVPEKWQHGLEVPKELKEKFQKAY
jgi:hypothetical protein